MMNGAVCPESRSRDSDDGASPSPKRSRGDEKATESDSDDESYELRYRRYAPSSHNLALARPNAMSGRKFVLGFVNGRFFRSCDLKNVSDELKNDREIVALAVARDGWALEYASDELKNDKEIVKIAVKTDGEALEFASDELKGDKDVVSLAVSYYGGALEYASDELKNDREIVSLAVFNDGEAIKHASSGLKSDKQIAMEALEENSSAHHFIDDTLKDDPDIIAMLVQFILNDKDFTEIVGSELCDRLQRVHEALTDEEELPSYEDTMNDGVWERFAAERWRMPAYESIWLLTKSYDQDLPNEIKTSIIEYSGLGEKIHLALELTVLANMYRKLAQAGWYWDQIPCNFMD